MNCISKIFGACCLSLCLASLALANQNALPERFIVGGTAESRNVSELIERPQREGALSVDGSGSMIVSPLFDGSDGNTSYLRLINIEAETQTFTVTAVGSPSGMEYGTTSIEVPSYGSSQHSYADVLGSIGVAGLQSGDDGLSWYIDNPAERTGFQHVIYNSTNAFFENMSVCRWDQFTNFGPLEQILVNVHTSSLAGGAFPSYIYIHNYLATDNTANTRVYNSITGELIGTVSFTAAANTSYVLPFSYFEEQLSWMPTSEEFHANLVILPENYNGTHFTVGHAVFNQQFSAWVNLSQVCQVNFGSNVQVIEVEVPVDNSAGVGEACTSDVNCIGGKCAQLDSVGLDGVCVASCTSDFSCSFGSCAKAAGASTFDSGVCISPF